MDGIHLEMRPAASRFASRMGVVRDRLASEGEKAIRLQMQDVRKTIVDTTPVDTGRLKSSWSPVVAYGQLAYGVNTPIAYAPTLEYGGYPRVGPRTIRLGGGHLGAGFVATTGIYSQQAPLGWVRRALANSQPQLQRRLRNALRLAWGDLGEPIGDDTLAEQQPVAPIRTRRGRRDTET